MLVGGSGVLALSGMAILEATALLATGWRPPWVQGPVGALVAGASSGVLSVLAAASGPPAASFAAARGREPAVTTATLQAFALPLTLFSLAAVGLPSVAASSLVRAAAGLVLGTEVALPLTRRFDRLALRRLTLVIAATGGALLVLRAVWRAAGRVRLCPSPPTASRDTLVASDAWPLARRLGRELRTSQRPGAEAPMSS